MRVSSRSRTRVLGRWKGVFLVPVRMGVADLDVIVGGDGEGDVGGVEPRGDRSSGGGGSDSFALPLTFDDMLSDDHAHLRWSHTSRKTRIKKIWSMTDSMCCLDLGGSMWCSGWGAGASDGDE